MKQLITTIMLALLASFTTIAADKKFTFDPAEITAEITSAPNGRITLSRNGQTLGSNDPDQAALNAAFAFALGKGPALDADDASSALTSLGHLIGGNEANLANDAFVEKAAADSNVTKLHAKRKLVLHSTALKVVHEAVKTGKAPVLVASVTSTAKSPTKARQPAPLRATPAPGVTNTPPPAVQPTPAPIVPKNTVPATPKPVKKYKGGGTTA